jgi:hypothetical protein
MRAEGRRQRAEGRGQKVVFITGIYAPTQQLIALKGNGLNPIASISYYFCPLPSALSLITYHLTNGHPTIKHPISRHRG